MKRYAFFFLLMASMIAIVAVPTAAQESPFSSFCSGTGFLQNPLPTNNPCTGAEGVWYVEFVDGRLSPYRDYSSVTANTDAVRRVWFVVGELDTATEMSVPESGAPRAWTELVCRGDSALVYQGTDEMGDGVTVSLENEWGCSQNSPLFLVEPWGAYTNADSGCFVYATDVATTTAVENTWAKAREFADENSLHNGSFWVVPATMQAHPMVVACEDVTSADTMGLNPHEDQVSPERAAWVINRATELAAEAGYPTLEAYCVTRPGEKLTRLLCPDVFVEAPQTAPPALITPVPTTVPAG
jgi:hypothetical protein